jgi:hypothetical protein
VLHTDRPISSLQQMTTKPEKYEFDENDVQVTEQHLAA